MKKGNHIYHLMLFSIFLCCFGNPLFGQERVNLSAGIGFPEALNMGVQYQLEQAQIGISLGTMPIKDEKIISVSSDVYFHFGGLSALSNRRPWYLKIGLNYYISEPESYIAKHIVFNLRFGRDMNISKKMGIRFDAGAAVFFLHEEIPPQNRMFDLPALLPSLGIALFYRL